MSIGRARLTSGTINCTVRSKPISGELVDQLTQAINNAGAGQLDKSESIIWDWFSVPIDRLHMISLLIFISPALHFQTFGIGAALQDCTSKDQSLFMPKNIWSISLQDCTSKDQSLFMPKNIWSIRALFLIQISDHRSPCRFGSSRCNNYRATMRSLSP